MTKLTVDQATAMLQTTQQLLFEMERKLASVGQQKSEPIGTALEIVSEASKKLKTYESSKQFRDLAEEVRYFKHLKPRIISRYFYFYRLSQFDIKKRNYGPKELRKFFKRELKRIQRFYQANLDFIACYRSRDTSQDHTFFIRQNCSSADISEKTILALTNHKETKYDLIVAKILANDLIYLHVEKELLDLKPMEKTDQPIGTLSWTGSKASLVELIYALSASKAINNGEAEIKEIIQVFEQTFNFRIGSPYQAFSEIKSRKIETTKFLDHLKESLQHRFLNEE